MTHHSIVLVRPPVNEERNAPFFLPLGLLSIAAPTRNAGFGVEIVDYEYLVRVGRIPTPNPVSWIADLCDPIIARAPQIVGLTALADTMPTCLLMGRHIRQNAPETIIVIGGPGVFGTIDIVGARYRECFDYLCINEGELALLELAERLKAGERLPAVQGLWSVNPSVQAVAGDTFADIDELPMPAYDLLPVEDYVAMATPRIFDIHLGTGCTYSCKFCVTAAFWKQTFRAKSPASVMAELDYLYDSFGISEVNFLHDNFANNKAYLQAFIDYFIAHNTRYSWGCAVRPDNVTGPQLKAMRLAGCTMIFCGTDSGSPKILKSMTKMAKVERSYRFFENCRNAGIDFETNAIIGFPDEANSDLEETLDIVFDAVAYGAKNSDVSLLQPLPGAKVTQDNMDALIWVGSSLDGAFLPPQVLEMAERDLEAFTGFAFIRRGNRAFAWYQQLTRLIRFFTRHYFRTLYLLKQRCGVDYLTVFERMISQGTEANLDAAFSGVFESLDLGEPYQGMARAVYAVDCATEAVKGVDVSSEIANIYARPESDAAERNYVLLKVEQPVHMLFERLPQSVTSHLPPEATSYLIFRTNDDLVTLRLANWQVQLWTTLSDQKTRMDVRETYTDRLVADGIDHFRAAAAVNRAADLFTALMGQGVAGFAEKVQAHQA